MDIVKDLKNKYMISENAAFNLEVRCMLDNSNILNYIKLIFYLLIILNALCFVLITDGVKPGNL
jgi:hypothetical protein